MTDRPDRDRRKKTVQAIRRQVRQTIGDHRMIAAGEAVLAAVSGGPDSMALLDLLCSLSDDLKIRIGVAHLDHNLRGEDSRADADFVARAAAAYDLPFYREQIDIDQYRALRRLSPEEAARRLRYDFLENTAWRHGYERIAVGHNAEDNAESVLLFLLRGSGTAGLGGIQPTTAGRIMRPLIRLKRREIKTYLDLCGLPSVTDRSNLDMQFVRNRIRHRLLPWLQKEFNPAVVDALNRLAHISQDEETWLQSVVRPHFEAVVQSRSNGSVDLSAADLQAMPRALQRRVLRAAIAEVKGDLRGVGFIHAESIRSLLEDRQGEGRLSLPGNVRVRLEKNALTVFHTAAGPRDFSRSKGVPQTPRYELRIDSVEQLPCRLPIGADGRRIHFTMVDPAAVSNGPNTGQVVAFFDMNKLVFPLVLRGVRAGDRFSPMGVHGSQKVKKFFIDHKIPRTERAMCPVLISAGTIVWLVGHRIDDAFAASAHSRVILKVELLLV